MIRSANHCPLTVMGVLLPLSLIAAGGPHRTQAAPVIGSAGASLRGTVAPDPEPDALSPVEWARLAIVQTHLEQTQRLTESDIAFADHLLRSKPPLDTPQNAVDRQRITLAQLTAGRPNQLTPAQRKRLFDVVLPCTRSGNSVVQGNAMIVLASTRDPRVIPVLRRLESSSDPFIHTQARLTLHRFQTVLTPSDRRSK
jgi:hypothetical protein